jgi:hypothetical protein
MATAPEGIKILNKLHTHLNDASKTNKNEADFEIYDINLIDNTKEHQIYMYITTILKEYPTIMIDANIDASDYKNFSDELKLYILLPSTKNMSFCDLILFDIICSMRLDLLSLHAGYTKPNDIEKIVMCDNLEKPDFINKTNALFVTTITDFLNKEDVKKALQHINNFIKDFSIPMEKKYKLYKILHFLLNKIYDIKTASSNEKLLNIFNKVIGGEMKCAPRTIIEGFKGGYNNKSGDIDYHICKANFKQTFKKVSAKSAREGAKMVAMKVLKDKKKSVKFSLKRMIGKKEKCYDYDVSIDKSGKIIIKNQS